MHGCGADTAAFFSGMYVFQRRNPHHTVHASTAAILNVRKLKVAILRLDALEEFNKGGRCFANTALPLWIALPQRMR